MHRVEGLGLACSSGERAAMHSASQLSQHDQILSRFGI